MLLQFRYLLRRRNPHRISLRVPDLYVRSKLEQEAILYGQCASRIVDLCGVLHIHASVGEEVTALPVHLSRFALRVTQSVRLTQALHELCNVRDDRAVIRYSLSQKVHEVAHLQGVCQATEA